MASSREVHAWRLVRPEYAPGLDGEGARLWGGRWNSPGRPVVYAASSLALAVLEYLVHVPPAMRRAERFPELVAVRLKFRERDAVEVETDGIPGPDADRLCRERGDAWLNEASAPILRVPSIVVPQESNWLLNPRHPAFAAEVKGQEPFHFDPRLGG